MRSLVLKALALLAALAAIHAPAQADIAGDTYESETWRVTLTLPKNWQATEKTSYPNILLWMVHPSPRGRLLVAAEELESDLDPLVYANKTIEALGRMGFETRSPQLHPSTGAYWVDYDNGDRYLRTAVLVSGKLGFSLTLAADDATGRSQLLRAFDSVLRSIKPLRGKSGR